MINSFKNNIKLDHNLSESTQRLLASYQNEELTFDTAIILFELLIKMEQFNDAITLLDKLFELNKERCYIQDFNYYLYMLSFIIELPEYYQRLVKKIDYNSIRILDDDSRYKDISSYNGTRRKVLKRKFNEANEELNNNTTRNKDYQKHIVEHVLITNCIKQDIQKCLILNSLIKEKRYEEVIYYLEHISNNRFLSKEELGILYICKDLINEPIDIVNNNDGSFLSHIINKDYQNAYLKTLDNNNNTKDILKQMLLDNIEQNKKRVKSNWK